jgi:hypothetical protein
MSSIEAHVHMSSICRCGPIHIHALYVMNCTGRELNFLTQAKPGVDIGRSIQTHSLLATPSWEVFAVSILRTCAGSKEECVCVRVCVCVCVSWLRQVQVHKGRTSCWKLL